MSASRSSSLIDFLCLHKRKLDEMALICGNFKSELYNNYSKN